jgi:hypothetical protein
MKSESEGLDTLDDFRRDEGIPAIIRSDNSKAQRYRKQCNTRLREWLTGSEYTEPHHPQQSSAEFRVCRWKKECTKTLQMQSGALKHL